jgi:hypothetical protein
MERKNSKIARQDLFPLGHINYKQLNRGNAEDPMKLRASPAHSNRFMEKMLLKVLKRAGYDEAGQFQREMPPNATVDVKPVISTEFHRSLSKHKKKDDLKHHKTPNRE